MQAEACKSTSFAMKKCPNGMLAEIKYDGERVQVILQICFVQRRQVKTADKPTAK